MEKLFLMILNIMKYGSGTMHVLKRGLGIPNFQNRPPPNYQNQMPPNNLSSFPRGTMPGGGFGSNGSSPDYPGDNVTGSSPGGGYQGFNQPFQGQGGGEGYQGGAPVYPGRDLPDRDPWMRVHYLKL